MLLGRQSYQITRSFCSSVPLHIKNRYNILIIALTGAFEIGQIVQSDRSDFTLDG